MQLVMKENLENVAENNEWHNGNDFIFSQLWDVRRKGCIVTLKVIVKIVLSLQWYFLIPSNVNEGYWKGHLIL